MLTATDLISPHHGRDGITRYELAEPLQQHHHHLVCLECGRIDDVAIGDRDEDAVHVIVNNVSSAHGFTARDHMLEIEGICERCS